jgi:hypothetical protein
MDGVTPHYDQLKYPAADSPTPLATGLEAKLIQAEILLLQNDIAGFVESLDVVRAYFGLPPVEDPGTTEESVNLLFSERAFTLYGMGQRLGDLRRLVSVYGREASTVFPTGAYHRSGLYGTDGNFPVPLPSRGPGFTGCTVRTH